MKQLFLSLLSLVVLTGPVQAQQGWRVEGGWISWKLEGGDKITLLFVFDGVEDGGPAVLKILKPTP